MKWLQYIQDLYVIDIVSLNRRWIKYKIKTYLPYILIVGLVTLLGIVLAIFLQSPTATKSTQQPSNELAKKPLPVATKPDTSQMLLEPSMHFIQSIATDTQYPENNDIKTPTTPKQATSVYKKPSTQQPLPPLQNESVSLAPPTQTPLPETPFAKAKPPTIKRDGMPLNIQEIEARFKNNSNPHLGLYIARYHYDHGNYNESYNYALKTNSINNEMEESWLIFAKSLIKLGKKDEAIKTLEYYISKSRSESAKNLLHSLEAKTSK